MNAEQIQVTWRQLLIYFVLSDLLVMAGLLWNYLGSEDTNTQTVTILMSVAGGVMIIITAYRMIKFKKHLQELKKNA
jgi:hypothetical protein